MPGEMQSLSNRRPTIDPARFTALGRFIDLRHSSNRFVVAAAGLGGITTGVVGLAVGESDWFLWAFRVAAAIFIGWALARELDPDHPVSASIAAVASGAAVALGAPEIGAMAGFIIAIRIVTRSTGISAHPWELAAVALFAGYLSLSASGWPAAIVLIAALWIDGGHDHWRHPASRWAAIGATVLASVGTLVATPLSVSIGGVGMAEFVYAVGVLASIVAVRLADRPTATGDHDRQPLSLSRLKAGRILAGLGLALAALLTATDPAGYAPLWAAVVATAAVAGFARSARPV